MKLKKKDILILVIPIIIMIAIMPLLPSKIPMQWDVNGKVNWYLDRKFSFIIGIIPFAVYELHKLKHGYA
ncbi:DUF1648 domain-containing protein [Clostridium hydrogenum]|uniref:DUF1648 domain-containing protein n=1 Tax=Clostridium hydrogenum TaxID=2855764 RepID=UPI001F431319|nr:DUF1648 domain-containing protein [Clostridium hydrogenum]